jgi:hypothetical protein
MTGWILANPKWLREIGVSDGHALVYTLSWQYTIWCILYLHPCRSSHSAVHLVDQWR